MDRKKLQPPRLRYLGRVAGLAVYLVSGEQIRNTVDIDFTAGGQEAVYPSYVPAGEIWIDDALHALDRTATVFHEIVERELMLHHGMDYDQAHDVACKAEIDLRKTLVPGVLDLPRAASAFRAFMRVRPAPKTRTPARKLGHEIAEALKPRGPLRPDS